MIFHHLWFCLMAVMQKNESMDKHIRTKHEKKAQISRKWETAAFFPDLCLICNGGYIQSTSRQKGCWTLKALTLHKKFKVTEISYGYF